MKIKILPALIAGALLAWTGAFAEETWEPAALLVDEDVAKLQHRIQKLRDQVEKYGLELSDVSIRTNPPAAEAPKPVPGCTVAMDRDVEGFAEPVRLEASASTCLDAWHQIQALDEA